MRVRCPHCGEASELHDWEFRVTVVEYYYGNLEEVREMEDEFNQDLLHGGEPDVDYVSVECPKCHVMEEVHSYTWPKLKAELEEKGYKFEEG